jgi:hypothetical protein
MKRKTALSVFVGSFLMMFVFTGATCIGPGEIKTGDEYFSRYEHIMRLATQVAVINVLEINPSYSNKMVGMAEVIATAIESESVVDLESFQNIVISRIDWSQFNPTERVLVEAVLSEIRVSLQRILEAECITGTLCFEDLPKLPENFKTYANKFVMWIKEGVGLFLSQHGQRSVIPVLPPIE